MSDAKFKRYKVGLEVGRKGVEIEVIVSAWDEDHIEGAINQLYDYKATVMYCVEITHEEDK